MRAASTLVSAPSSAVARTIAFFTAVRIFEAESFSPLGVRPVTESPCNRVCTLDPASGLCIGCGRTLDEITRWTRMSDAERERVVAEASRRSASRRRPAL